jgi:peptidyl-prolyl cis-trans isomerase A (cyclophilin A)
MPLSLPRPVLAVAAAATVLLNACGGGGDAGDLSGDGRASVSSASVGAVKYGQTALVTINGTDLTTGAIAVASPGCTGMTRSTTAPNVSTATTAYYTCKVAALGAQAATITRTADGATLGTAAFDVPAPQVTMTVSNGLAVAGSMVITLAPDKTPLTVDNFLAYVNSGFYDGTIFHRLQPGFVIQGGGYLPITTLPPVAKAGLRPAIPLEVNKGLSNVQWTIAMARTDKPDTATSQFFVNLVDNAAILDPNAGSDGYAVFGTVTANTALVAAIAGAPCVQVPSFLPVNLGCVPNPNMVISKAEQTR